MEGDKPALNEKIINTAMFLFPGIAAFIVSVYNACDYESLLRNTIVAFIISAVILFMIKDAENRGSEGFLFDNYSKKYRFIIAFFIMTVISCVLSFVPALFWPYMSFFVILSLLSNAEIGLVSGIFFTMLSVMLGESVSYSSFCMFVLAGVIAVAFFRDLKEDTAIIYPLFISLLAQSVLIVAFEVLFQNRTLSLKLLMLPIINLLLNLIIMLVFLNMFGVYILRKSNDMYMEINDTEYPLLISLKEKDKNEYYRAIHTGYLSERVSKELSLNDRAAKTCAYYHKIGKLEGKKNWEEVSHYYTDNNFPPDAIRLLREYINPGKNEIKSKETLTVYMCELVVTAIMYAVKKDKEAKIDYDKVIDNIFDRAENEEKLVGYDITYWEYAKIRKILKKEKLYYDFLR